MKLTPEQEQQRKTYNAQFPAFVHHSANHWPPDPDARPHRKITAEEADRLCDWPAQSARYGKALRRRRWWRPDREINDANAARAIMDRLQAGQESLDDLAPYQLQLLGEFYPGFQSRYVQPTQIDDTKENNP